MKYFGIGFLSFLISTFTFSVTGQAKAGYQIEAFGDSITAGFVSDTSAVDAPPLKEVSHLVSDLAMYFVTKDRRYVDPLQKKDLAWPSVVAAELGKQLGQALTVENLAVSGSRIADLSKQVEKIQGNVIGSRSFFFAGHNDLCHTNGGPEVFTQNFTREYTKALTYWDEHHTQSVAYIIPVADIHRVYRKMQGFVWFHGGDGKYSCNDSWEKLFPYCRANYHRLQANTLEDYFIPRLGAINSAIEQVVHDFNEKSTRNRYYFLSDVRNMTLDTNYFAVDCYHLSVEGQKHLADGVMATSQVW